MVQLNYRRDLLQMFIVFNLMALSFAMSPECLDEIKKIANNNPSDSRLLYDRDSDGNRIFDNRTRITLQECYKICGSLWTLYSKADALKRWTLWEVPLFLLIGNFQLAPTGGLNSLSVVLHLLGDPVDTMTSLMCKIEVSRRLYSRWALTSISSSNSYSLTREQARDLATVNAVYDDWSFSSEIAFTNMRCALRSTPPDKRHIFFAAITKAAHKLSESRVDDYLRAWLAVIGYIVAVCAAFFKTFEEGAVNRTAHTIAFALLFTWLVPAVLLSTTVGTWNSRRAGPRVLHDLAADLGPIWTDHVPSLEATDSLISYTGLNYSYRPQKRLPTALRVWHDGFVPDRPLILCYILAIFPILLATSCGVALSWFTPTEGLGCRSITQISFFTAWIFSAIISHFLPASRYRWGIVVAKDFAITVVQFGFLISAFIGRYNSCFCWSAYWSLYGAAYYELADGERLAKLMTTTWSGIVTVGLLGQAVATFFIRRGDWAATQLLNRSEQEREQHFTEIVLREGEKVGKVV